MLTQRWFKKSPSPNYTQLTESTRHGCLHRDSASTPRRLCRGANTHRHTDRTRPALLTGRARSRPQRHTHRPILPTVRIHRHRRRNGRMAIRRIKPSRQPSPFLRCRRPARLDNSRTNRHADMDTNLHMDHRNRHSNLCRYYGRNRWRNNVSHAMRCSG